MPGIVHWNHPGFFAYFPTGGSYASLIGDMLSSAFNQIGFSWVRPVAHIQLSAAPAAPFFQLSNAMTLSLFHESISFVQRSSPALTEHEQLTMNMFARALDLPKFFLSDVPNSKGGGAMQCSASDCIMLALIAARYRAIGMLKPEKVKIHDSVFLPNLVAYTSEEAHSCVQKAAKIAIIKVRVLPTDENGCFRGDTLAKAIEHDVDVEHLTPIFVSATVGTTGTCAFDKISELGAVCQKYPTIWFHVDGAYGGNSFILPEMRKFKEGLEYADSFNVNANKLLLTSFDSSCFWVKNLDDLKKALSINPTYLEQGSDPTKDGIEFRNFGVPLSRRFRSLKLWCVLRSYGLSGLRQYIRHHMTMAKRVEANVSADNRFTLENQVHLGLVCFRMYIDACEKIRNFVNIEFCERLNASGKLHLVPTTFHGRYIIRFCVTNENATIAEIGLYIS